MTDLLLDAIRAAVRTELSDALDARLGSLTEALRAATPARGLSPADFAAQSGLSTCTVRRRIKDGSLPHRRIGGRIVIPADALRPIGDVTVARLAREARGR
jgi:hypothetical protein